MLAVYNVNTFLTFKDTEDIDRRRNSSCPPDMKLSSSDFSEDFPRISSDSTFSPKTLWSDEVSQPGEEWPRSESPRAELPAATPRRESPRWQSPRVEARRRESPKQHTQRVNYNSTMQSPRRQQKPRQETVQGSPRRVYNQPKNAWNQQHSQSNLRPDSPTTYGSKWKHVTVASTTSDSPSRNVYMSEDPWSEVIPVVQDNKRKKHTKQQMPHVTGPRYLCTFFVGIEDDRDFTVAKRIIGPKGYKMRCIAEQAPGSKIRLRGKGSMFTERDTGYESNEPLQINIATDAAGYERTKELVANLLTDIYYDYEKYCGQRVSIKMTEDPRNPQLK